MYGGSMDNSLLDLPTLKDLDITRRRVFMRVDINSPIDPETGKILDDRRIRVHAKYIKEIVDKYEPALVIGSHQGRPGERDFTTLEEHAELLSKYSGVQVKFVDDVMGPAARSAISELRPGEVLLLDNLRLVSEEVLEGAPEAQSMTVFVRRLSGLFDYYVNDAFATAHRSQPSIVGFPLVLPSAMGPLFEKEVIAAAKIFSSTSGPRIFILGGSKVHDLLRVIENLVRNRLADRILTTGLLAQLFLVAKGVRLGDENVRLLEEKNILTLIPRARLLLMKGAPIETPVDVKTHNEKDDAVENVSITKITGVIKDIGETTLEIYCELIKEASLIVMRGPAGVIEDSKFREGTLKILDAVYNSRAFVVIAGGHLGSMIDETKVNDRIHVSTGGNALLLLLSGEELPAIKALQMSKSIFHGGKR
ncbi:phosphoglycerate kinase [Thermogladius calderae]|nr:phosphoglycerate kinase [Thermogladius calderae]